LREIVEQAAGRKRELVDQPEIEAGVDETLGGVYFRIGEYARAEALFREALELRRRAQGAEAPEVAHSLNYLGLVYSGQSRWVEAERSHEAALQIQRKVYGPEHVDIARTCSTLGWVLAQQAKLAEAERYLRLALEQQRKLSGPEHADVAATLTRLGSVLTQVGRVEEAEEALRGACAINIKVFGRDSLEVATSLNFLAVTVAVTQLRLQEAIGLYREASEIRQRLNHGGPALGRRDEGSELQRFQVTNARGGEKPASGSSSLEEMLTLRGGLKEVEAALADLQRFGVLQYGKGSWEEAFYLALTAWVFLQEEMFAEAEAITRQSLAIRLKLRPDDWSTFHARHMLGFAKAGQKQFDEAEPLLIEGYEGMKARVATMPTFHLPRLGEAAQRIVRFYEKNNRPAEAARWQLEFDRLEPEQKKVLLFTPVGK
jgi:tetratricopeptide (TPR) repeat protein